MKRKNQKHSKEEQNTGPKLQFSSFHIFAT